MRQATLRRRPRATPVGEPVRRRRRRACLRARRARAPAGRRRTLCGVPCALPWNAMPRRDSSDSARASASSATARLGARPKHVDNSRLHATCQRNASKNNGERPRGRWCSARRRATGAALLERLGLPVRGRRARTSTRRRCPAKRPPRRRCACPKPRRAPSPRASPTRSSSARTRSPTATGARSASRATATRAIAQLRALSGPHGRLPHRASRWSTRAAAAASSELVDVASTFRTLDRRRDRGLPRPRAALRLRRVGAARRRSASRSSSASRATIRRR